MSQVAQYVSPPACAEYNPRLPSQYGYRPTLGLCIAFSIIFALLSMAHIFQTWKYRTIWTLFFVIGSGLECLGWIARAAGWGCAYSRTLFTLQTSVLIMGT